MTGTLSRRYAIHLPELLGKDLGDALWAVMVYMLLLMWRPSLPVRPAGAIALVVAGLVETSQLYHAPWIDRVRATYLGHAVLGQGFRWRDLFDYAIGVGSAALVDRGCQSRVRSLPTDGPG